MLSAYLFDEQEGKKLETWVDALDDVREGQLLWLDLAEACADEKREVGEALGLDEVDVGRFRKGGVQAALVQGKGYLRVTAVAVGETKEDAPPQTVALDCFVGENWVVTAHDAGAEALDGFRDRVEGEGALGVLDAPSFLAELLEWVVTSYLRAFDQVEADLEEFDVRVLGSVQRDSEREIGELIDARRRVGRLRRASRRTAKSSPHCACRHSIPSQPRSRHKDSASSPPERRRPFPQPRTRGTRSSARSTC